MPSNIGGVRSFQRAFDVLSLLTEERRTLTIRAVVDETGLAKTTALRLLQTLEHMGLLWATPKGFTAGPAFTLSGPTVRFGADRVREFAADLREAAERMSRRGFDHPLT
ncbi:helix-turn-helix domain-containing protein [[Actinomadura] parvosata]|uniref:helix-turn-helix domain-containing protein n=1 Tax=[Actinomadura] parvosata TaxID=1955412 RepID=UPI00406C69C8